MKLIPAFFKLVRWPNLVFIILTQFLFYTCVIMPHAVPSAESAIWPDEFFWLLSIASIFIAAAGYIINDYFDINIDRINKPDKLVVDATINRRWAILLHLILSFLGFAISAYLSWKIQSFLLLVFNTGCIFLLWFYSTTLKKKLLVGNIAISLLTAWVILVLYLALENNYGVGKVDKQALLQIFKFAALYAGFAFIISLIREVVKDMEDMEGDARYGCRTMPIAWGVPVAKVFTGVWIFVLVGAVAVLQFYLLRIGWSLSAIYGAVFIMLPLCWVGYKLYQAQQPSHYHKLSTVIKLIMFAGILSMVFVKYYF
jgi:4-hydroxybenzoate polyprenyltransferase